MTAAVTAVPAAILLILALGENGRLELRERARHHLEAPHVDVAVLGHVAAERRQRPLVLREHIVEAALGNVQRRHVRHEIIADEKAHEHEVVNHALERVAKRQVELAKLEVKVLAQNRNVQQLEGVHLDQHLLGRAARAALAVAAAAKHDLFAQQRKVRVVRDEREHDEVGVEAVEAVPQVRVVVRLHLHAPNVVHDLVLALAGHLVAREDDLAPLPRRVQLELHAHKVAQVLAERGHELGARRDAVRVEDRVHVDLFARALALRLVGGREGKEEEGEGVVDGSKEDDRQREFSCDAQPAWEEEKKRERQTRTRCCVASRAARKRR